MASPTTPAPEAALVSLLSFWAEAGVDVAYADEAQDRLTRATPPPRPTAATRSPPPSTVPPSPAGIDIAATVDIARQAAAAADTLEALEAAIAAFDGCVLKTQGASRAVFARGDPKAPVMLIGEGPGAEEDRTGQPFVGRAGQLLDRMLAAAGLTGRVFITNTVFWRPPGNRTPTSAEQAVCRPFVERAIELVSPKLLMLSGAASSKFMLKRTEGVLSLRGKWMEWTPDHGGRQILAIPTLHPAFLLRQPAAKKLAWADLLTLAGALDRLEGDA